MHCLGVMHVWGLICVYSYRYRYRYTVGFSACTVGIGIGITIEVNMINGQYCDGTSLENL